MEKTHSKRLTIDLAQRIGTGEVPSDIFTEKQLKAIMGHKYKIPGLTWFYNPDDEKMELVPDYDYEPISNVLNGHWIGRKE